MFRWITSHLAAKRLKAAQRARLKAWEAHRLAVERGDTRRQHETRQALTAATTTKLRLELGAR